MKNEERDIYTIPPNFIEGGTLLGGMFRTRNVVEAGILAVAIGGPVLSLHFSLTVRIIILCLTALPLALVALIGINGSSLSSFFIQLLSFLRNRRVLSADEPADTPKKKPILPSWARRKPPKPAAEDEQAQPTVIERDSASHYVISEEPAQNVTVVYDEVAEVTFYNDPYGTLRIEKRSNTGQKLQGAVITIEHIESGQTFTAETTSAGVAIFDEIPLGAYRIQEETAPVGWKLDDTVYTATVVAGETTTIPIINEELPGLRIIKYDRKNMVAMPDVTFAVYRDGEFLGNFKTDQFGEILLTNVEPGTYRAFEVDTGDGGYILDTTPQEVELHAGDGIKELMFFNDVKPGLRLVKVDSDDPSKVIPKAVFEIRSVEGTYGPQEFRTDQNGEIDLSMLPAGSYVVTEKSCDGYIIDEAQRIIELKPNEDAQFVFTNHIKPSLQLIKLSSDGSRLAGVTFRIAKIEDGSHYLDRTTSSTGEILISDLEPGVYSVRELSSVSDHIPDDTEHHVELFPGQTSTITLSLVVSTSSYRASMTRSPEERSKIPSSTHLTNSAVDSSACLDSAKIRFSHSSIFRR